jgi:hypothetical protein
VQARVVSRLLDTECARLFNAETRRNLDRRLPRLRVAALKKAALQA